MLLVSVAVVHYNVATIVSSGSVSVGQGLLVSVVVVSYNMATIVSSGSVSICSGCCEVTTIIRSVLTSPLQCR